MVRNLAEPDEWVDVEQAARPLGLELHALAVRASDDLGTIQRQIQATGATAVLIPDASPLAILARLQSAQIGLPIMFPQAYWIRPPQQGLISLGVDGALVHARIAALVDRILKGAKPGDLPVEVLSGFGLAINARKAADLRLTIPPSLLQRADNVIE